MRFLIPILLCAFLLPASGYAQETPVPAVQEMAIPKKDGFHLALLKAIKDRRKKGEMSAVQALRLRVALISPAFRKKAEDLAVTQMAFSGEDSDVLKRTKDGKIDRASIDWEGLTLFLEKLLPFLLQLLEIFAAANPTTIFV